MSDYGKFLNKIAASHGDDVEARENAVDNAIRAMDRLKGRERMEYAIDLILKGGKTHDDIADALCGGGSKIDWEALSEAFEEGAWQEYVS